MTHFNVVGRVVRTKVGDFERKKGGQGKYAFLTIKEDDGMSINFYNLETFGSDVSDAVSYLKENDKVKVEFCIVQRKEVLSNGKNRYLNILSMTKCEHIA